MAMAQTPPSHLREISEGEQWLIDRIAEEFMNHATWPKLAAVQRVAAQQGIELPELYAGTPMADFLWRMQSDGNLELSLTGLWRSATGKGVAEQFVQFALLCRDLYVGDREANEQGEVQVNAVDLREILGFDDESIRRIHILKASEYFITGGGGSTSDTDWWYGINPTVTKLRDVSTIDEYLKVRAGILAPQFLPISAANLVSESFPAPWEDAVHTESNTYVVEFEKAWTIWRPARRGRIWPGLRSKRRRRDGCRCQVRGQGARRRAGDAAR